MDITNTAAASTMTIELANKFVNGRCVGHDFVVTRRPIKLRQGSRDRVHPH